MAIAICEVCGGQISDNGLARRTRTEKAWIHMDEKDWVDNVHQAVPMKDAPRNTGR